MENNEMDYVVVSDIEVALAIKKELEKKGLRDSNLTKMTDYNRFTQKELASIKSLKLEDGMFKDISVLQYMTNLRELSIKSIKVHEFSTTGSVPSSESEIRFRYDGAKSQIKDYSPISKLKSLEYLSIENEQGLETLDLSELKNLNELELMHNTNLRHIRGMEKLRKLNTLKLLKNNIAETFDLPTLIEQNFCDVKLDVDLYPMLRKNYPNLPNIIKEKSKYGQRCSWIENVSDIEENAISTPFMEKMNGRVEEILDEIVGQDYSDIEKVTAIYEYITENVKYDHEALDASKDEELKKKFIKTRGSSGELIETTLRRRQSSYNAIMENRSVCEGYTNMMHYMLKSAGIESVACTCDAKVGQKIVGRNRNHAVLRAKIGNDWYYFDPTWDASKREFRHFMKTKDEFNLTHSLSVSEESIENPEMKKYTEAELNYTKQKVHQDKASGRNKRFNAERKRTASFENMTKGNQSTAEEFYDYIRREKEKIGDELDRGLFEEDKGKKDEKVEKTDEDYIW